MCETTWDHWENPEEGFHEISFFIIAQYAFEGGGGKSHEEGGRTRRERGSRKEGRGGKMMRKC